MPDTVLISTSSFGQVGAAPLDRLRSQGLEVRLNPHGRKLTADEMPPLLAEVDGLLAGTEPLGRPALAAAPRLRAISRCGVGLDNVDLVAAEELGIRVANTPDAHVDPVAELTLGGMLDLLRHLSRADRDLRRGTWRKPMGGLLRSRTVGLLGLGKVGRALVRLLVPFQVEVLAWDSAPDTVFASRFGVRYLPLDEVLAMADIVSIHLPGTAELHHLLDSRRLSQMRQGAMLVNAARGGLVDEAALAEQLRSGRLGGAFLDVFENEPYKGPLTDLDNVLLTPHIGSYAKEGRLRMEMEAVENLLRLLRETTGGQR